LLFRVKSEFVSVVPKDGFVYFWMAFMKSKSFLENLPVGSGGTRPRLQPRALAQTPVVAPPFKVRKHVHETMLEMARQEWKYYTKLSVTTRTWFSQEE
jgi:hypothetical protein